MCGISGTFCSKKINTSARVEPMLILSKAKNIETNLNFSRTLSDLLNLVIKYKSDINFINYFRFIDERKTIEKVIKILKIKIKKEKAIHIFQKNLKLKEKAKDIIWFLEVELKNRYSFVKKILISNKKNTKSQSIIFFRVLGTIINSINFSLNSC